MTDILIEIPFTLGRHELMLDPGTQTQSHAYELSYLADDAGEAELPRILTAAVCLWHATRNHLPAPTIAECLHTAIIWERG